MTLAIDGPSEVDRILTARLEKCIGEGYRYGIGHTAFHDPKYSCRRCGISRRFRHEPIYLETKIGGYPLYQITGTKVTLL